MAAIFSDGDEGSWTPFARSEGEVNTAGAPPTPPFDETPSLGGVETFCCFVGSRVDAGTDKRAPGAAAFEGGGAEGEGEGEGEEEGGGALPAVLVEGAPRTSMRGGGGFGAVSKLGSRGGDGP